MRPRHVVAPLLLYTSACAVPHPPSADFLARAEQVPPPQQLLLPASGGAYAAWQLPAEDPWARYSKGTLLASLGEEPQGGQLPDVRSLAIVQRAERAAALLAAPGLPSDALWLVDLRGAAAVAFGNALSHLAPHAVSLVLTFNNWPAANELIPAEETLAALVTLRPRLPEAASLQSGTRPVFLLDAWRLAYRDEAPDADTVDNRYYLSEADLPDAATLQAHGIRHVIYVTETLGTDPSQAVEEDDVHDAFVRYGQAGVALTLVGLDELAGERPVTAAQPAVSVGGGVVYWPWWHRRYVPTLRRLIFRTPGFYSRSRGGFGGPRARPSFHGSFSHGGSHGGHGGG